MDKDKIFLIDAFVSFSNLSLLTSGDCKKFIAKHCDSCGKISELQNSKKPRDFCGIVSKEVLFLESLADTLPSLTENVSKNELSSVGKDLINVIWLFLSACSFKPVLSCDTERHSVLSRLTKISSRISETVA